jgi:predicted amidohydrolase
VSAGATTAGATTADAGSTGLAAVVQLTSTSDAEASCRAAEDLIRQAAARGATLVATPENTNYLGPHDEKVRRAEPVRDAGGALGPTCARFAALARELGIHLLLGSFNEASGEPGRCYNTSVLFGPDGEVLATYRKVHLFDVCVPPDVVFQESATVVPGEAVVVAATPLGQLGLSICYDLRFPELYRALVDRGAEILAVPAAFTATTGKDHWEPLLRARAIENQCWVLAPAQCGHHDDGGLRASHGHAMVIDPWGHVVARASDGPGIAVAEIDLGRLRRVRERLPALAHRKL